MSSPTTRSPRVRLAARMERMSPSAVREILKVAERPDVLSFAGGLPAPELFPVEAIAKAHADVFAKEGRSALQYSTTEGHPGLRGWISERLRCRGVQRSEREVLITNGSQQGIDLVARAMLEPGDTVFVEDPTYLAALQVFASHQVRLVAVPSDDAGMQVEALDELIALHAPRLIYVVTDFQNPKGVSLSFERRRRLVQIAQRHAIPIIEDDPYGELRFSGAPLPPLAALDDSGLVVYLSTFSKTLAPGMRLGWLAAKGELLKGVTILKQSADLHTSTLSQRAAFCLLQTFDYDGHLAMLRRTYGGRCEAMVGALERHLPAGTTWTRPEGGLFIWVRLPPGLEDRPLFAEALKLGVAFVPGHPFFVEPSRHEFIRLNYSNRPPALIDEGMRRMGRAANQLLEGPAAHVG